MTIKNNPPDGWALRRDRQRWAMGVPVCLLGVGQVSRTQINAAGVLPTDYVAGVINLSTVAEAQADLSAVTPGTGSISSSATNPWTDGDHYLLIIHRRQVGR